MAFSIQQIYRRGVILLCLALTLLVAAQIFVFSFFHLREDYQRELATEARMVAGQISTTEATSEAYYRSKLSPAAINDQLVVACVRGTDGTIWSALEGHAFKAGDVKKTCRDFANANTLPKRFIVARTLVTDVRLPKAMGEVVLVAIVPSLFTHFGPQLLTFGLVIVAFVILSLVLGQHLLRAILRPLRQIATTAQRVTLYKDYSLRVTPGALIRPPQEIELLIESFNTMLKEIEDRDARLMHKTVELEKLRQHAEAANIAKSQFLANVSHELRTPLNAIIGFSTMISEQQFGQLGDAKYVEYAKDINDSGRHLLDVINDILDLSKAESGKLSIKFEKLAVPKLVEKALHIVAGSAHTAQIDIYTDIPEKIPKIIADGVRLVQILLNLLSNAIKFSQPGGKILVRVSAEPGKGSVYFFNIEVEDHGIGMNEEEIRRAFVTFNQSDAGLLRRAEGAGLGLPLTKRLVELHHGKIKIESVKGHGTKVTVRLTSDPALLD